MSRSNKFTLRPYQEKCLASIPDAGAYLVCMATGLGKGLTFSRVPRRGRMLILSHRDELIHQPEKYFNCSFGVEQGKETSHGEEVVSASVQSLVRRLDKFKPDDFDVMITDECHHAAAPSYRKIYDYFTPRLHLGFTATPNRNDGVGLKEIYQDIIFQRDLRWGIENHYLSPLHCLRVDIGYDLRSVAMRLGDYAPEALDKAVNEVKDDGLHVDISGKADKVSGATAGNLVTFDANGNIADSGITFATDDEFDEMMTEVFGAEASGD